MAARRSPMGPAPLVWWARRGGGDPAMAALARGDRNSMQRGAVGTAASGKANGRSAVSDGTGSAGVARAEGDGDLATAALARDDRNPCNGARWGRGRAGTRMAARQSPTGLALLVWRWQKAMAIWPRRISLVTTETPCNVARWGLGRAATRMAARQSPTGLARLVRRARRAMAIWPRRIWVVATGTACNVARWGPGRAGTRMAARQSPTGLAPLVRRAVATWPRRLWLLATETPATGRGGDWGERERGWSPGVLRGDWFRWRGGRWRSGHGGFGSWRQNPHAT